MLEGMVKKLKAVVKKVMVDNMKIFSIEYSYVKVRIGIWNCKEYRVFAKKDFKKLNHPEATG
jgi:hypothetical protein